MWIFLSEAFLSIVDDKLNPGYLMVRARVQGDIEHVFPGVRERHTPGRDYAYRASVHSAVVAERIALTIRQIGYGNFKDSVRDDTRHDAYLDVWGRMHGFQLSRNLAAREGRARQHPRRRRTRRGGVQLQT